MDRQALTRDTVYVKSREMTGWLGEGVKTTENKIHWLRWQRPSMQSHSRLCITTQLAEYYYWSAESPSLEIHIIGTDRRAQVRPTW
jgi:hypothetical protein